jgi:Trk-type K+ transport system membrane component
MARGANVEDSGGKDLAPAMLVPAGEHERLANLLLWLFCGYITLMPIGAVALRWASGLRAGNELTADRALFTSINALTLTGFRLDMSVSDLPIPGRLIVLLMTLGGAMFVSIVGGMAVARLIGSQHDDRTIVAASVFATLGLTLIGAIPLLEQRQSVLEALMLSASAFGNSGLYFGARPRLGGIETQMILLPLSMIGLMGAPVWLDLYAMLTKARRPGQYARDVVKLTAMIYLAGFLILMLVQFPAWGDGGFWRAMQGASAGAIDARGLGFDLKPLRDLPPAAPWVMAMLMLIGGNIGGTAGGIGANALAASGRGLRQALRGDRMPRLDAAAICWTAAFLALIAVGFLIGVALQPRVAPDRVLLVIVSAATNCGLSHDQVQPPGGRLHLLSLMMLAGRVGGLGMLWWVAWRAIPSDQGKAQHEHGAVAR